MSDASVGSMEASGTAAETNQDVVQMTATVVATAPPEVTEPTRERSPEHRGTEAQMQLQGRINKVEALRAFVDIGIVA